MNASWDGHIRLQRGRACEGAEMHQCKRVVIDMTGLQRGRACEGAEIGLSFPIMNGWHSGFNGAAPVRARKSATACPTIEPRASFNGAAPVRARK